MPSTHSHYNQLPNNVRLQIRRAVAALRNGGVIAYPTEAVYGLGCDPRNHHAVKALLQIKERPQSKGLILIASSWQQIIPWLGPVAEETVARVNRDWPGPVTYVLPVAANAPDWLIGNQQSIAVRVTGHPVASAICEVFGQPIVSTSANRHGQAPARTASEVRLKLSGVDAIINAPTGNRNKPTEIRDALCGRVLREG